MSDSDEETPVSAKNLIKGYEKGEVFKSGDVTPSERPDIKEPLAKSVISDFEAGKMYKTGEINPEKPDIMEPVAKNLISSFEKGGMYKGADGVKHEKPVSRPGATRKLQKVYESMDDSAPLSPTSKEGGGSTANTSHVGAKAKSPSGAPAKAAATKKTVLLVFAHWSRNGSFNGAMQDVSEDVFKKLGYNVLVSDLYAMKWNPIMSMEDAGENAENPSNEPVNYLAEIKDAVETGKVAKDIAEEHKKIKAADLIIFQFPLSWLSFPAILKGWLDRVLTNGFAFVAEQGKLYDQGFLKGKKAMLSITTGGAESVYRNTGVNGDIEVVLWAMQYGALRFSGFDILAPELCYGVTLADDAKRKMYLENWRKRLTNIFEEDTLEFVPLEQYDLKNGLVLKEDSAALKSATGDVGVSIGQNLGRAFPPGAMLYPQQKLVNGN